MSAGMYYTLSPAPPLPAPPSVPLSMSVCWSNEGVGVFSLLLRGGQPRARLLWTAGGATLSPLTSSETEEMGDDGQRELRSVCALQRAGAGEDTSAPKTAGARTRGGRAISRRRGLGLALGRSLTVGRLLEPVCVCINIPALSKRG